MSKKLSVDVEKIYLVQQEQGDLIVFVLQNVPSPAPDYPDALPILMAGTQPGYGGVWLEEAFGLQPDEVIGPDQDTGEAEKFVARLFGEFGPFEV